MNKFAEQFQNDVVVRYQQKMADFDPDKDYGHLKADDMQAPETTWFENLANSAPVSALLDAAEATGVDRWADNNFMGDVGTELGNLVNKYDASLSADKNIEAENQISLSNLREDAFQKKLKNKKLEYFKNFGKYQDLKNSASGAVNTIKNWGKILRSVYESAGRGASIEHIDGFADFKNLSPKELAKIENWLDEIYLPMTLPGGYPYRTDYAIPKGLYGTYVNIPEYMMHAAANLAGGLPPGIMSSSLKDVEGSEFRNPIAKLTTGAQRIADRSMSEEDHSDLAETRSKEYRNLLRNNQAIPTLNFGEDARTVSSRLRMDNIGPRMVGTKQKRWDR